MSNGHTITISIDCLKVRMVELWRSKITIGFIPADYEARMTHMSNEYLMRTGLRCDTVGCIWKLENWYDKKTPEQISEMRNQIEIAEI